MMKFLYNFFKQIFWHLFNNRLRTLTLDIMGNINVNNIMNNPSLIPTSSHPSLPPILSTLSKLYSLLSLLFLLIIIPRLLKCIWPSLLTITSSLSDPVLYTLIIVGGLTNISALVWNNLYYWVVYSVRHPWLEGFRVNPELKWPWEIDEKR